MEYNEALDYIHSLGNFSLAPGLDRIRQVLKKLGNPQNDFPSVHIAGTNGKGSVCSMISSVFCESGLKTGLFISPFITRFNERIQINSAPIPDSMLASLTEEIKNTGITLGEFEFITALCFLYFSREKCDVAVIETGLGGRLDPTNILENVRVSVITKIGLDHIAFLGDTVEKIAAEKCGIIKNGAVVSIPNQPKDAEKVIKKHAKNVIIPDLSNIKTLESNVCGNRFIYKGKEYQTRLVGGFQIENAVTAIEAVINSGFDISQQSITKGIESAFIPARIECVHQNPTVIIDGAHNVDAACVLREFMKPFSGKITAVFGAMQDKDFEGVMELTLPLCKRVVTVKAIDTPRAVSAHDLSDIAQKYCADVTAAKDIESAVQIALEDGNTVFIFGSLYLAAAARHILTKQN